MKKLLGYLCLSFMLPVFLFAVQLLAMDDIPHLEHFNLYLQPIIAGFILDFFLIILFGLIYIADRLGSLS